MAAAPSAVHEGGRILGRVRDDGVAAWAAARAFAFGTAELALLRTDRLSGAARRGKLGGGAVEQREGACHCNNHPVSVQIGGGAVERRQGAVRVQERARVLVRRDHRRLGPARPIVETRRRPD